MAENRYTYDSIKDVINSIPDNFKILEESIDINIQKEFFESNKNVFIGQEEGITDLIKLLHNPKTPTDEIKVLLQKLASLDSVEAFRAIEQYCMEPHLELKEWAILSLQQSKLIIQSSLLDEQLVFISTGLGGRNGKLRYFLIFPYFNTSEGISDLQSKMLKEEIEFFIAKYEGEIEDFDFKSKFASVMLLLPLKAPIPDIIKLIIDECNQYGSYLSEDVLITNMKKLDEEEITEIIEKRINYEE